MRTRVWIGLVVTLTLAVCAAWGVRACGDLWAQAATRDRLALARDVGWTEDELRPLPADNGAPTLIPQLLRFDGRPRSDVAQLDDARIDEALAAEAIRVDIGWDAGGWGEDHAVRFRYLADALLERARQAQARGESAAAWRDVERVATLAERWSDPLFVARMLRTVILIRLAIAVDDLLAVGPPPVLEVRQRLRARLARLETLPSWGVTFTAELALDLASLDPAHPERMMQIDSQARRLIPAVVSRAWYAREIGRAVDVVRRRVEATEAPLHEIPARLAAIPPLPEDTLADLLAYDHGFAELAARDVDAVARLRKAGARLGA